MPLKDQAKRLGIEQNIRLLGMRQDIPRLLALMDVFVLPSLSEGLSMALLEAMAAGKPVVATRVGGNPELVEEGKTGILVAAEDSEHLSRALIGIISDKTVLASLGQAGMARLRSHFSRVKMVEHYCDHYAYLTSQVSVGAA